MSPRPTGLSLQESLENLFYEGKQMTVGYMPTGAPLTLPVFDPFKALDWSAIQVRVKRLQMRIAKAVREMMSSCTPGLPRPLKGLSRVKRNFHARFLGEWRLVTVAAYPT